MSFTDLLAGDSPLPRVESISRADRRRSNINVTKSVALLNDAVGTPGFGRKVKTPLRPKTIRKDYTLSASMLENTVPLTPGWLASMTLGPQAFETTMADHMGAGEAITTNISVMAEEMPEIAASTGLFEDFKNSMKTRRGEQELFDLLNDYENLCKDQVSLLCKVSNLTTPGRSKTNKLSSVLHNLTAERSTWALLNALYRDRLDSEVMGEEEDMLIEHQTIGLSENHLMQALFERDALTRQAQIVIDWLEQSAESVLENYYSQVEFSTDKSAAWENTLYTLQQKSHQMPMESSINRLLVTEMDPDAPLRQKKQLADLDKEDEDKLFKYMFALIRAGQLDELCIRCGQAWRAASLEGWRLYHDPNYEGFGNNSMIQPINGNMYRDVWKSVAWTMAEDEHVHPLERAIYASYCGNLKPLLSACKSWHDYTWAYCKVLVDNRVEQEIQVHSNKQSQLMAANQHLTDFKTVFKDIEASPNENIRKEGLQSYQIIQKYIILGDIDGLLDHMNSWLKMKERPSHHLIRFMAHLVLFANLTNLCTKDEVCTMVLEAYVSDLIEEKHNHLVAAYVSKLPKDRQVQWYARFLEGIHEKDERQNCLILAEEEGLDVPSITKLVVENIRAYGAAEFSLNTGTALEAVTTEEDRIKIEAIDWLVFDETQRAEAMRQANAVMRSFMALKKHDAARAVFNKIPTGSIDAIHRNAVSMGLTELEPDDDNAIREHLCIQAYLDAHDSFNDWFKHFHHSRPEKPVRPDSETFTVIVAYEHKHRQYEADLERWQHSLMSQTKTTVDRMYNVLLFVDAGWMVDVHQQNDEDNESRRQQMVLLRQLCLPTICFLLHKVLHATEQYQECIQLADVVASERYALYKVFPSEELQKLLRMLQESSVALLDKGLDPLGYNLT
ncbi:nuclear pore complex protein Nup107-like isoform X2 [Tubulanus polymorphus]|uniref:nuclear pore complex protein Nup107-like isoform X2 n=1 Tax=Tubulanus polymorphus TaxID=672921 RepID=UPI003DA42C1C